MKGGCQQRHFPAVAQPFRILWAPWAPAVFFFVTAVILAILGMALLGASFGGILLPVLIVIGHVVAILLGLKMRYMASILAGMENRRAGTTNLTDKKTGSFEFANL